MIKKTEHQFEWTYIDSERANDEGTLYIQFDMYYYTLRTKKVDSSGGNLSLIKEKSNIISLN